MFARDARHTSSYRGALRSACHRRHNDVARGGFSFLELQVAFLLLGMTLAAVVPLMVMQSRQLKVIESRLDAGQTHYLIAAESAWARKLGVPAAIKPQKPERAFQLTFEKPAQTVTVLSLQKSLTEEAVTAHVRVSEIK